MKIKVICVYEDSNKYDNIWNEIINYLNSNKYEYERVIHPFQKNPKILIKINSEINIYRGRFNLNGIINFIQMNKIIKKKIILNY